MKIINSIVFLIFLSLTTYGQIQNPPSIKWKQIDAEHTTVIFPQEIESEAQRVANTIDYLYKYQSNSLSGKPKKIPILLFNRSTISNAYAAVRPWRSVWYTTPAPVTTSLSSVDWFNLLSAHEYRHLVQYSTFNQNFTKFLNVIFGQKGILIGEYSAPNWFFEGDAVCTETAFSLGGRGRIPQFEMPIRTLLLSGEKYSYDKAKFRSYKDYYPSHYNLGWLLTSYGREKYGKNLWDKVCTQTSKVSFWPFAFSTAMKKHTGKNEKKFYDETMDKLTETWKKELNNINLTRVETINKKEKKIWTKYAEPYYLPGGDILLKKGDLKNLTAFYRISPDGKEKKIKFTDAGKISLSGNKIVWTRHIPSLRWEYKNYSDIIIFDINSKIKKKITKKGKYFSPALSNDCSKIAAIEYTSSLKCSLVILDAETGSVIKKYPSVNNELIRTPRWSENGKKIVYTNNKFNGSALTILDTETGEQKEILPHSFENISCPLFYKNYIIYNSSYSGTGNIYAVDINTQDRFQITSVKFGAYNASVKDNKMVFMHYTAEGYDIAEISIDTSEWKSISDIKKYESGRVKTLFKQEQNKNLFDTSLVPKRKFEVTKYKKFKNGLKIHSWGPGTDASSKLFLDIVSANRLNTFFITGGGEYDVSEKTAKTFLNARYAGLFPIFDISSSYGQRYKVYNVQNNDGDLIKSSDIWNEAKAGFKITLPFNFSRGLYTNGLRLSSKYVYTQTYNKNIRLPWDMTNGGFSSLIYSGSFHAIRKKSLRDINTRFGTILQTSYSHTPFNDALNGFQYSVRGVLYLPSIFKNHSIKLKGGYEEQSKFTSSNAENYYWFSSKQAFTRGYDVPAFEKIYYTSIEYHFPIVYPEFGLGPLVYFKRIRGGFYYDHSIVNRLGNSSIDLYRSVGVELHLELRIFRIEYPIEIGCRVSYLFSPNGEGKEIIPEFLLFGIPLSF